MWSEVYETAAAGTSAAAGYYNRNVRVECPLGPVNVRIPIHCADLMDLRIWAEEHILSAIVPYAEHVPRLLHVAEQPRFQVHDYIEGDVLNAIAPRSVAVPAHVPADVVRLLADLIAVPRAALPPTPDGWPRREDTVGFGHRLSDLTRKVFATYRDEYSAQYAAFGFPDEPVAPAVEAWSSLTARPLVFVHSDIHRKNIIVKDGISHFLDWELALWGDPVYDLALHIHKMDYAPAEQEQILRLWKGSLSPDHTVGCEHDLDVYLAHEQIKSAVVDTVRYSKAFVDPTCAPEPLDELVRNLTSKLNNAHRRWSTDRRVEEAEVECRLRDWALSNFRPT